MSRTSVRLNFIEKFLSHFNSCFSTANQRSVFKKFIYAMFDDYNRMPLAAIAREWWMQVCQEN